MVCVCVFYRARVHCMHGQQEKRRFMLDISYLSGRRWLSPPATSNFFFLSRCSSVGIGWASQLRNVSALERHLKNEPFRKINLFRASAESMQEKSPIPSCFNKIPIKEITPAGYTSICEVSLVLFRASFPFVMLPSCRQLDSGAMPNQNRTTESRSSAYFFSLRHDLRCQRAPMNSGFCRITPDGWLRAGIIRLDVIERIGCVSAFLAYWHTTDYQLYFSCVSHKSNLAGGRYVENCSCTGNHSPILLHKRQGKCNKSEPHLYEVIRVDRINNCKPHQKLRITFFLD